MVPLRLGLLFIPPIFEEIMVGYRLPNLPRWRIHAGYAYPRFGISGLAFSLAPLKAMIGNIPHFAQSENVKR